MKAIEKLERIIRKKEKECEADKQYPRMVRAMKREIASLRTTLKILKGGK